MVLPEKYHDYVDTRLAGYNLEGLISVHGSQQGLELGTALWRNDTVYMYAFNGDQGITMLRQITLIYGDSAPSATLVATQASGRASGQWPKHVNHLPPALCAPVPQMLLPEMSRRGVHAAVKGLLV